LPEARAALRANAEISTQPQATDRCNGSSDRSVVDHRDLRASAGALAAGSRRRLADALHRGPRAADRTLSGVAVVDVVDRYVESLPDAAGRRLAHGEWGLTIAAGEAGGWPLHVGVRLADGLIGARAHALDAPIALDPWMLLWWNRQTRLVRFAAAEDGAIWVHGELPVAGLDERAVDRLLGLVVEGATAVRDVQRRASEPQRAMGGGWIEGRG